MADETLTSLRPFNQLQILPVTFHAAPRQWPVLHPELGSVWHRLPIFADGDVDAVWVSEIAMAVFASPFEKTRLDQQLTPSSPTTQ